jgi:hypothetical protein
VKIDSTLTTIKNIHRRVVRPYIWYKRFLVEGAQEHLLPPEYIAELERIDAIQDSDEQRDRERRALACR